MRKYHTIFILILLILGCNEKKPFRNDDQISLSKVMRDLADEDFSKALEKHTFVFPQDHAAHPEFRTE